MQLGPVMAMVNGPVVAETIGDPENAIAELVKSEPDDLVLINELFLANKKAPYADTYAAIMAIRFHGTGTQHGVRIQHSFHERMICGGRGFGEHKVVPWRQTAFRKRREISEISLPSTQKIS